MTWFKKLFGFDYGRGYDPSYVRYQRLWEADADQALCMAVLAQADVCVRLKPDDESPLDGELNKLAILLAILEEEYSGRN